MNRSALETELLSQDSKIAAVKCENDIYMELDIS